MVGFQLPMLPAHKMRAPSVDGSDPVTPGAASSEPALPTVEEQPQTQRVLPPQLPMATAGGPPPLRGGPPPLPRGVGPPPRPQAQQQPPPLPEATAAAAAAAPSQPAPSSVRPPPPPQSHAVPPMRAQPPPHPQAQPPPQRAQPPPHPKPAAPPALPQPAHRGPPPMPAAFAPPPAAVAPVPAVTSVPAVVPSGVAAATPPPPPLPPQSAEESEVARSMLTFLLEELSPSVFTRKKEALDTFDQYYFKIRPTYTPAQVQSLLFGCTATAPNERNKGLLALCGFTSWKSAKLKKAAGRALAMLAKLCDSNANPHAQAFLQPFINSDISVIKMLRLGKHLGTSRGDRAGATFLLSLLKNYNARLYDAAQADLAGSLSAEDDAALKQLRNDALARRISLRHNDKEILRKKAAYGAAGGSADPGAPAAAASVSAPGAAVDPKAEKQTIKSRLMAFFGARPSAAELERRGLIRSKSFGVSLEDLSRNATLMESHESAMDGLVSVPAVLATCCSFMERNGLITLQGVFRLSGDSLEIAATRDRLDLGAVVDLAKVGPHSVSGLVKLFLRSLPEPLLRFDNYEELVSAFRADSMDRIDAVIARMAVSHRHTLIYLLDFLARVNSHSEVNMMTDTNLSICVAPNILRPRVETYEKVAKDTPITIGVVRYLIATHAAKMAERGLLSAATAAAAAAPAAAAESTAASSAPADLPGGSAASSSRNSTSASGGERPLPSTLPDELAGASAEAVAAASQAQFDADGNPIESKPFTPSVAQFELANALQHGMNRSALKSRGPPPLMGAAGAASPQRQPPPSGALPPPLHPKPTPPHSDAPVVPSMSHSANVPAVVATPPPHRSSPSLSRESSLTIPEHFERLKDPQSGAYYYFNKLTNKVTWRRPDLHSDALDASDPHQLFPPPTPPPVSQEGDAAGQDEVSEPIRAPLPKPAVESGHTGDVRDIDLPSILPAPPKQPRRTSRMLSAVGGGPGLLPPPPLPVDPAKTRADDSSDDEDDDDGGHRGSVQRGAASAVPPPLPTTLPPPFDDDDDIPIDSLPPPPAPVPAAHAADVEVPAAAASAAAEALAPIDDPDLPPKPSAAPPPLPTTVPPALPVSHDAAPPASPDPTPVAAAAVPDVPVGVSRSASKESSTAASLPASAAAVDDDGLDVQEDEEWDEFTDALTGKAYFFNKRTNETTWTNPFTTGAGSAASPRASDASASEAVSRASQSGPDVPATYESASSAYPSPLYGGWSAVSIRGRWDGASAAGCFPNFASWYRNPQFHIGVAEAAAADGNKTQVVVQLQWERLVRAGAPSTDPHSPIDHNIAGFYILRNTGPALQKLYIHADEVVARSEFEAAGSVEVNTLLEPFSAVKPDADADSSAAASVESGAHRSYVLIPSSFEPGYVGDFTITIHSEQAAWIQPVQQRHKWIEHSLQSQWLGDTAGGCRNHVATFPLNPQFELTSSLSDRPTPVLCLLSQTNAAGAGTGGVAASPHAIGWYAINSQGKIEAKGPFQTNLEVHSVFHMQPASAPYVLVPCTFAPGLEGNFTLSVFAPPDATITLTQLQRT